MTTTAAAVAAVDKSSVGGKGIIASKKAEKGEVARAKRVANGHVPPAGAHRANGGTRPVGGVRGTPGGKGKKAGQQDRPPGGNQAASEHDHKTGLVRCPFSL